MSEPQSDPIDAVYTWVDGAAPGFADALARAAHEGGATVAATAQRRFRDNHELRFSLRALHRHARWIRRIYLLTNGQVPAWLEQNHPKLAVVHHNEVFARPAELPTFNSFAIELQLHRIPGLARRFLYFNDDMLLGRPIAAGHFRATAGGQRFFSEDRAINRVPQHLIESVADASLQAIGRVLGPGHSRRWPAHAPVLFDRDVLAEIEVAFDREVRATTASRVRRADNLWPALVYRAWRLAREPGRHEEVVLRDPSRDYRFLCLDGAWWWWARSFVEMSVRMPTFVCINDDLDDQPLGASARLALARFYHHILPAPSPFERSIRARDEPADGRVVGGH